MLIRRHTAAEVLCKAEEIIGLTGAGGGLMRRWLIPEALLLVYGMCLVVSNGPGITDEVRRVAVVPTINQRVLPSRATAAVDIGASK